MPGWDGLGIGKNFDIPLFYQLDIYLISEKHVKLIVTIFPVSIPTAAARSS